MRLMMRLISWSKLEIFIHIAPCIQQCMKQSVKNKVTWPLYPRRFLMGGCRTLFGMVGKPKKSKMGWPRDQSYGFKLQPHRYPAPQSHSVARSKHPLCETQPWQSDLRASPKSGKRMVGCDDVPYKMGL